MDGRLARGFKTHVAMQQEVCRFGAANCAFYQGAERQSLFAPCGRAHVLNRDQAIANEAYPNVWFAISEIKLFCLVISKCIPLLLVDYVS